MGFFNLIGNAIKNTYRAVTGQMSMEQEWLYRKWSGYEGKIMQASKEENLKVNIELQRRIWEDEGKLPHQQIVSNSDSRYYWDLPKTQRQTVMIN